MACPGAKTIGEGLRIYPEKILPERGKVKADILASTRELAKNPERYPPDKYRKNNDGSFRDYELHRYRIAYQVTDKEIIIVRVRHTSMEPLPY